MNYLQNIRFQFYPANIKQTKPLGEVTLYQYLYAIKNPQQNIVEVFKEIEKASKEGNLSLKSSLKQKLFYFTPCVYTNGENRNYESIVSWNEILILDFDNLEPEFAVEFKEYLFKTYSCIIAVFLSASKCGIKALVRIPKCSSVDEFKSYFYGIASEMQYYRGWDASSKNCSLPNFLTYDPDLLYRLDATVWDKVGIQIDEFKEFDGEFEPLEDINPKDVAGIKLMIKRMLDKIEVEQTAHLTIRSLGLLIGGWCSYGYFDYDEIQEEVLTQMDEIQFLHKSMRTYKTTFKQMMVLGSKSPLKYENER